MAHHRSGPRWAPRLRSRGTWCWSRSIWLNSGSGIRCRSIGGRPRMRRGSHLCLWSCRGRRSRRHRHCFGAVRRSHASRRVSLSGLCRGRGVRRYRRLRCGGRRRGNRWLGCIRRWCGNWRRGTGWRRCRWRGRGRGMRRWRRWMRSRRRCSGRRRFGRRRSGRRGMRRSGCRWCWMRRGGCRWCWMRRRCGWRGGARRRCLRCFLRLWLSVGAKLFFGLCHNQRRVLRMRWHACELHRRKSCRGKQHETKFCHDGLGPRKIIGKKIGDQRISVRPDCGGLQRRSCFYF